MSLSFTRITVEQTVLAMLVGSAVGSFAHGYRATPAWLLLLPCVAALFFRIDRVSPRATGGIRYLVWAILGATVLVGLILMAYPVLLGRSASMFELVAGYSLATSSVFFLLGSSVWPLASALLPATLGTMVVAAFNARAPLRWGLIIGFLAVVAHLALTSRVGGRSETSVRPGLRRLFGLGFSILMAAVAAWGIMRLLPWTQAQLELATFRFYSTRSASQPAGFSRTVVQSQLGRLQHLKLSPQVVLRVWTTRPQKLRGIVSTKFDGQHWYALIVPGQLASVVPTQSILDRSLEEWLSSIPGKTYLMPEKSVNDAGAASSIRSKIFQVAGDDLVPVAPGNVVLVRSSSDRELRVAPYGAFVSGLAQAYGVINRRDGALVQPGAPPASMVAECLAVPAETDPRLKELAAQLGKGAGSNEERIERTVRFLQSTCRYSLDVGSFRSSQPVAEFVFEKKKGYCEYFASAAVVLLRLQGVPARYVTGYNVEPGNRQGDHYVVRALDAHAWVEAYVPGRGWLEVDPTPEAEYLALHLDLGESWWDNFSEWAGTTWAEARMWWRPREWFVVMGRFWLPALSFLLVAFALFAVLFRLRRRKRKPETRKRIPVFRGADSSPIVAELAEIIAGLDRLWEQAGYARPRGRAPLEHLESLPPQALSAGNRETSRRAVESFYRCAFGGVRLSGEELAELKRSVEWCLSP